MCKKPHKHAEIIKAWADGAQVEYKSKINGEWGVINQPSFGDDYEYRIKPEPKPDIIKLGVVIINNNRFSWGVKVTLDGENPDILKSVEVIHGKEV